MFDDALSLYEPIYQYKPFAQDIGIVDGPLVFMSWMRLKIPFTTRMTVIRLGNGDLFLHSPIAFDPTLAEHLQTIGRIRHLVSPNKIHYAGVAAWKKAFPDAIAWASPGVRERARNQGNAVQFDRDLETDAALSWQGDLDQITVPGSFMAEIVFFHRASKTLVLADLIENFELDKIRPSYRWLVKLSGAYHPHGKMPIDLRSTFWPKKKEVGQAIETILSWQPERIILSHGRCYEKNGSEELRRAFRWAL